jgi:hypothetical protein
LFEVSDAEKGVQEQEAQGQKIVRLIGRTLKPPQKRKFWLFGIEVTPILRWFAETLVDRKYIHQPNTLQYNNKAESIQVVQSPSVKADDLSQ